MPSSEPLSPARWGPFATVPAGARLTFVWATPLAAAGIVLLAQVVGAIPMVPVVAAAAVSGDQIAAGLMFWMLVAAIVVTFAAMLGMAWVWTRGFERRGAASIGLKTGLGSGVLRYLRGVGLGLVLTFAALGAASLVAPQEAMPPLAPVADRLFDAQGLIFLAGLLALFCFQGGVEEVVFRGWLLSSVAARRGPVIGALVSAAAFALVHAHYLFNAPLTGLLVLGGVALIGLTFAFVAMAERSVWGVCGAHGAYNFVVIAAGIVQGLAEDPDLRPIDVAVESFTEATTVTEFDPALGVTLGVVAVLAAGAWALWRRSPAAAAARAVAPPS